MIRMNYKKIAEELFEIILLSTGITEDIQMFNYLCDRYPELMADYVAKIEKEVEGVELPQLTEEEERQQYEKLMKKIEELENGNGILKFQ